MTRDARRLPKHRRSARCEQPGGFRSRLKKILVERSSRRCGYLLSNDKKGHLMKATTIALATAFTLTSTFALAQADGTAGYGSVVAPSVGSYPATVGSTTVVPTWRNTGPAAPLPSAPAVGNAFGNSFAPAIRASGVRR